MMSRACGKSDKHPRFTLIRWRVHKKLMGQSHSSSSAGAAPAPPAIPMGPVVPTSLLAPAMSSAPGMYLRESNSSLRSTARSPLYISMPETDDCVESSEVDGPDYTSDLPDDILACIFQFLSTGDRKRCSLVCQRWLLVEGRSRHRLSLNAQSEIIPLIPCIFFRFDSVSKLTLKCDRRSISISDDALILISNLSKNLTRLKLRGCRELTDVGMAALAKNCKGLKKLSCGSCTFGTKGINAVLDHCSALEELSVKRLRGMNDRGCPGVTCEAVDSLRARREALIVNLDAVAVETLDASTSDGGAQEDGQEPPPMAGT
ncbi:unnamed protein product, partial [Vitis vinifera]